MKFVEFRRLCLSMPEAEELETWGEATFRVRGHIFAMGSPEGASVSVKASLDDQAGLVAMDPKTFAISAYTGAGRAADQKRLGAHRPQAIGRP